MRTYRRNDRAARDLAPQRCEYEDCEMSAVGWVEAQWTIVDFVRYEGCFDHLVDMRASLHGRRVEGYSPDIHVHFYDE